MTQEKTNRLLFIDLLKGIAILGVIAVHARNTGLFRDYSPLAFNLEQGARGVQLFFIVSGLTLFLSQSFKKEKLTVTNFYLRRLFRIVPLFYLMVFIAVAPLTISTLRWAWPYLTFTSGWMPSLVLQGILGGIEWTLTVFMSFYLIFPIIFYKVKKINQAIWLVSISFIATELVYLLAASGEIPQLTKLMTLMNFSLISQIPYFALGILVYFLLFTKITTKQRILVTVLWIMALTTSYLIDRETNFSNIFYQTRCVGFWLFGLTYLLGKIYQRGLLALTPLVYLGKVSFGVFLAHQMILNKLDGFIFSKLPAFDGLKIYILKMLMTVGVCLILGTITYYLVEIPFKKLGDKVIKKLEKKPPKILLKFNEITRILLE